MVKLNKIYFILLFVLAVFLVSCTNKKSENSKIEDKNKGELIVFHAGSLNLPLKKIISDFQDENPGVKILAESAGSRDCARKISDLGRPCDVFISADYKVVEQLLFPQFTEWQIPFARNELVIAFNKKSKYASEINAENWTKILLEKDVRFARTNPDSDPCGYRTVLMFRLAQIHHNLQQEFYDGFLFKDLVFLRPNEAEILALLETHEVDYVFVYKSVAIQHALKFIELPDQINLSNSQYDSLYVRAEIKLGGKTPGEFITQKGESILYSITILKKAPKPELAKRFTSYFLEKNHGQKVMEDNHQQSIVPAKVEHYERIPVELRKFVQKK